MTIPDPFPIPIFKEETQNNLKKGCCTNEDCPYMVRTLSTILCTYVQKPTIKDCKIPSQAIADKYTFTMFMVINFMLCMYYYFLIFTAYLDDLYLYAVFIDPAAGQVAFRYSSVTSNCACAE